jgi:F5/8 type C domain/Pectate lyase superfamily protein
VLRKITVTGALMVLMILAVGLFAAASASAQPTHKAQRYRVVRHARNYDVVRGHHRTLVVRHHRRYVKVRGVRRYRVIKRAHRFVVLKRATSLSAAASTTTAILSGTPLSVGLPSSASSVLAGDSPAAANDGQAQTRWAASSRSFPQWWTVDLRVPTTVDGVKVSWYGAKRAYRYRIETSLDGVAFTTVADRSQNQTKGTTTNAFTGVAQYVRVTMLGVSPSGASASASEITVNGDVGTTPTPTPTPTPSPTESTLNVKDYGAKGDGSTNDSAAFTRAMTAATSTSTPLYVAAGTYNVGRLTLPDGLTLTGAGMDAAWLKGGIVFGSRSKISGLKLGDAGDSAVHNRNGASGTTFTACRFRGGSPGAPDGYFNTIALGGDGSVDHITFKDSEVERNLGAGNNISIVEDGSSAGGAHVSDITFDGLHVGVSNGRTDIPRNIGGPRAGIEVYTWDGDSGVSLHGWSNVNILNSVFEATDSFCIDLSDDPLASGQRASGPARVAGNTLKGGGWGGEVFGYTIAIEAPKGVVIENNTIYRGGNRALGVGWTSGLPSDYIIRDNVFPLDYDNGITPNSSPYAPMITLGGSGGTFSGNTVTTDEGGYVLQLLDFSDDTVTGNTFTELRSSSPPWVIGYTNMTGTAITGNTFKAAATSNPVLFDGGSNANNVISGNTFLHN